MICLFGQYIPTRDSSHSHRIEREAKRRTRDLTPLLVIDKRDAQHISATVILLVTQ